VDLDLENKKVITVDQQEVIKKRVAQFFAERSPVVVDGKTIEGRLDRIHFIHRSLRKTGIIEPPVDLDIASAILGVLVCGVVCFPFAQVAIENPFAEPKSLTDIESTELMTGLLSNTYHAFDHHDEKRIYDRLSKSISGDLLSEVYLETRKSMEVKNQGGLQISVKEVAVNDLQQLGLTTSQHITFRCQWKVAGWIGHWGHIHRRVNQHLAEISIAPVDGQWKIVAMKMLDEQPLDLPTDATATR